MATHIPRRNVTTGTIPELISLSYAHPKLKTHNSYHASDFALKRKYQLHEAEAARRHFLAGRWEQCRELCLGIISGKATDMVMARACMMLSRAEVDDEPRMRA
ncbi:unnamed protein product [Zymoseptoria tritici ST99CH_1A5]|nr:unnamed protein product [Zymoseptoria tritici ST99CH_1E4]SMR49375.1 unnamed protein product [Zymoseptoria tritici ST99CH_3D1]SMY22073.1 unnamed protein product [Zymoseptoria tritici ST99CH_1A5]